MSNTGAVIPADEAGQLFEPFRRLGEERIAGHGVGLGLSIVRSVARTHGGEATAASRPGGGLLVRATFPAATPGTTSPGTATPSTAAPSTAAPTTEVCGIP
jgi:signal transduction histidine kinase